MRTMLLISQIVIAFIIIILTAFDRLDLVTYEEVLLKKKIQRKTIVLIGESYFIFYFNSSFYFSFFLHILS